MNLFDEIRKKIIITIAVNGIGVNRPGRNGTYIHFHDATASNTVVLEYDCGWSPMVVYSGSTIIINAPYAWIYGHQYFITFDSGKMNSSPSDYCSDFSRSVERH